MDEMVDRLLDILADKLTERLSAGHKELYTAKELAERYGVSWKPPYQRRSAYRMPGWRLENND